MGIKDAEMDEFGYVYATIPSNSEKKNIPVICFCSHVDTAPDCSGTNVKPILHKNYDEEDIILPDDTSQVLSAVAHPYLREHMAKILLLRVEKHCWARMIKAVLLQLCRLQNSL